MFKNLPIALIFLILSACASKHKAKDIDTSIEIPSPVRSDSVVGVKDGDMIYQRKVIISEELRRLELDVYDLEAKVLGGPRYLDNRGLYGVLRDCRVQLGDVNNSGDGKVRWTENREYVTPDDKYSSMGIEDNKQLVALSEEFLKDRLERFKGYKKILESRLDEYETKIKVCQLELAAQKKKGQSADNN